MLYVYKVENVKSAGLFNAEPHKSTEALINGLAADGWELVSFTPIQKSANGTAGYTIICRKSI